MEKVIMFSLTETTEELIYAPRKFYESGNVSIYDLLKESGYFDVCHCVSEKRIRECLARNRECINDWIRYSGDKRACSGWYLLEGEGAEHIVGFLGDRDGLLIRYADLVEACAFFIKKEAEDIRTRTDM